VQEKKDKDKDKVGEGHSEPRVGVLLERLEIEGAIGGQHVVKQLHKLREPNRRAVCSVHLGQ
jgi:hypothetical protein